MLVIELSRCKRKLIKWNRKVREFPLSVQVRCDTVGLNRKFVRGRLRLKGS